MKISLNKVPQIIIMILMIYEIWYIEDFGAIPLLLQVLTILLFISVVYANHGKFILCKSLNWWIAFGISSLLGSYFIVRNKDLLISSIITYISFVFVCYLIYQVCIDARDVDWLMNGILFANIICAISVIFFGEDYNNGVHVITMGENNNPNYLGISMIYGTFVCFVKINAEKIWNVIFYGSITILFGYVIILSGSRSSLLGFVLLFVVILGFSLKKSNIIHKLKKIYFLYVLIGGIMLFFLIQYLTVDFVNSAAWERFMLLNQENGAHGRTDLYEMAVMLFQQNPIFGVGYNNFANASGAGYFSHSTYAETLACTGIVGCFLWFMPYVRCVKGILRLIKNRDEDAVKFLGLFIVLLFMGIFGILYYTLQSMVVFTILFVYLDIRFGAGYDEKKTYST